jgi:MoaA/NifB/PqqE/SkfB family radical SAM enzyme
VLAFSGGEPMMRPDWRELVRHAVARGLSVNVGSNGSLVTPRTADELKALGVHSVTISLDSHKAAVHEAFRRLPGLFDRAVSAVRLLVQRSVRVVIGFTPTRLNWRDGRGVVALGSSLGADAVNLSEYVPAGRGTTDLALAPGELQEVLHEWIELRTAYRGRITIQWHDCRVGMLVSEEEQRKYVGCGAGRLVARILPDGTLTPCVFCPRSSEPYGTRISGRPGADRLCGSSASARGIEGTAGCEFGELRGCRAVARLQRGNLAGDPTVGSSCRP